MPAALPTSQRASEVAAERLWAPHSTAELKRLQPGADPSGAVIKIRVSIWFPHSLFLQHPSLSCRHQAQSRGTPSVPAPLSGPETSRAGLPSPVMARGPHSGDLPFVHTAVGRKEESACWSFAERLTVALNPANSEGLALPQSYQGQQSKAKHPGVQADWQTHGCGCGVLLALTQEHFTISKQLQSKFRGAQGHPGRCWELLPVLC